MENIEYMDNSTVAENVRCVATAIKQSLNAIDAGGSITEEQDAALYAINVLTDNLRMLADIIEDIGKRESNG